MTIAGIDKFLREIPVLNLNSRMVDVKPFARDVVDSREQFGPALVTIFGNNVAAHGQNP
jgi:hypothetical protein